MVEVAGVGLFLYRPVVWCFPRGMKFLSILMVGAALATSGLADDKAEIERLKKEIEALKAKHEAYRLRQELADFKKGLVVKIDQIKIVDGTAYFKEEKEPFIGTAISYYEDGSKWRGTVWENGQAISSKRFEPAAKSIKRLTTLTPLCGGL